MMAPSGHARGCRRATDAPDDLPHVCFGGKADVALRSAHWEVSDAALLFPSHRGKQVLNNHKGIDLSGNAAAREDALALARDLKHGAVMPGWNWTGWFVAIVDQHGHKIDEVPIADA